MKEDPEELLPELLANLEIAAPTCIQGHTIRMLSTIHSYESRFLLYYNGDVDLLP